MKQSKQIFQGQASTSKVLGADGGNVMWKEKYN